MGNKKLLFLIVLSLVFHCSFSQIRWEAKGGIHYSSIIAENQHGDKANINSTPGLYLGLGVKIPIIDHFFLNPSIISARRGFRINGTSDVLGWGKDLKVRTSYIELPVDLLYTPKAGPGNLLVAAGPYAGYGAGGKWKTSAPVILGDISIPDNGDVDFQNDNSYRRDRSFVYARPWDYGIHFKVGYMLLGQYALSFEMQHGIANLEPRWGDYNYGGRIKNKAWGLVLSYTF